jgi:hypothetical protein
MKRSKPVAEKLRNAGPMANGPVSAELPEAGDDLIVAQKAAAYCLLHFPTLWTAGLPKWETASQQWVIPIVLRYPTGDERKLGSMTFDGQTFTPTTKRHEMARRARELEQDPAFQRRWHEQFPTAVPPRTA